MSSKVLIAYFSRTGSVESIANAIQAQTNGDLYEIIPETPYPAEYNKCTEIAKQEKAQQVHRPLKNPVPDTSQYDTIFIGAPIWWGTCPSPVSTFLHESSLQHKQVVPFCAHGGGGKGTYFSDVEAACPASSVLQGFEVYGPNAKTVTKQVQAWIQKLELKK